MPSCSSCRRNLDITCFTTAQLRKRDEQRRCKQCIKGKSGGGAPSDVEDFSSWIQTMGPVFQQLVQVLLSPARIHGVPQHLREPAVLEKHLMRVLSPNVNTSFLVGPLINGLLSGNPDINARLCIFPGQPVFTILIWLCQWKFLARNLGWQGQDEMVSMVLATPGIRVNEVLDNGCSAIFFAVKYGSAETLDLLIKAGINMLQLDSFGRTVLYNAIEYPNVAMMRRVLEHVPATEIYQTDIGGQPFPSSAADRILSLYGASDTILEGHGRISGQLSWINLGCPPAVEDVAESLILVRQLGATFTQEQSLVAFASLGCAFRGETGKVREVDDFKKLGRSVLGFWLPSAVQQQVSEYDQSLAAKEADQSEAVTQVEECSICLNPFRKPTDLYCGHRFCRQCIIDYSKDGGKSCPLCGHRLCRELLGRDTAIHTPDGSHGNIGNVMALVELEQMKSLSKLSDSQVAVEAKEQGFYSSFKSYGGLRDKLVDAVRKGHTESKREGRLSFQADGSGIEAAGRGSLVVELSATNTITNGQSFTLLAPVKGPCMIEITIKGIPIVAHLSNNSRYTTVSASIVKTFNLQRLEKLSSRSFMDALTCKKVKHLNITCLENLAFSVGGIEVVLRNAVQVSPDMDGIGVQLGQDFFLSGAYCVADVKAGGSISDRNGQTQQLYMRCDGVCSWTVFDAQSESFRYHSRDGRTARIPILHFNPHKKAAVNALTLDWDTTFTECNWCGRIFPKGMLACSVCTAADVEVYYCDERCQRGAWKLHKSISQVEH